MRTVVAMGPPPPRSGPRARLFARPGSTSGERLDDLHRLPRPDLPAEVEHLLAVHEEADVRAHLVLLVHDAEAQPRVAAVEVAEHLVDGAALGVDLGGPGVGPERARDEHLHRAGY